jgi:hypothetical protein
MNEVDKFCKNSILKNFKLLSKPVQKIFYDISNELLKSKNKKTNKKLCNEVIFLYKVVNNQISGLYYDNLTINELKIILENIDPSNKINSTNMKKKDIINLIRNKKFFI